jgi:hypothetical protein
MVVGLSPVREAWAEGFPVLEHDIAAADFHVAFRGLVSLR